MNKMIRILTGCALAAACAGCEFFGEKQLTLTADNAEVVVAADATPVAKFAAAEMTNFLSQAFGRTVPLVAKPSPGKVAVEVGGRGEGLAPDAYRLTVRGNRIGIVGRDDPKVDPAQRMRQPSYSCHCFDKGTLNGVYAFLERFAGCRFYFPGRLGEVVPRTNRIVVPEQDAVDAPDMTVRTWSFFSDGKWPGAADAAEGNRQKALNLFRLRATGGGFACCHGLNGFRYKDRFLKTHPEYFALAADGKTRGVNSCGQDGQLCFTSAVTNEIFKDCLSFLKGEPASVRGIPDPEHPGKCAWGRNICGKYVDVMPNDGFQRCYCDRCKKAFKPEGTSQFATDVIWGNVARLANRLTADGHDIHVTMMSYSPYQDVPAIDLPKNVDVMVATQGPWAKAMPERMKAHNDRIRAWKEKLGHKVWIWNYPDKVSCSGLLMPDVPQMSPHAWGEYYKSVKDLVIGAFAESESDRWFYNHLNYYVYGRVMWDAETDVDAVLDEYYRLMYGAGAAEVKELFETLEKIWVYDIAGKVNETPIGPKAAPPAEYQLWHDVYSEKTVKGFAALLDAAEAKVAKGSLEARRIALVRKEIVRPLAEHGAKYRASVGEARGIEARRGRPDRSILEKGKFDFVELKTTNYVKFAQSLEGVLKPNTRYRISYFVKADHLTPMNHGAGVYCEFYDNDYRWFPKWSPICGTTDWVYQSFDTKTAEKFDGVKRPYFMFFVTGCTGTAYVKDVRMEEITD